MQSARNAGAIVAAKRANALDDVFNLVGRRFFTVQNNVLVEEPGLRWPAQVHYHFQQIQLVVLLTHGTRNSRRQDIEQYVKIASSLLH